MPGRAASTNSFTHLGVLLALTGISALACGGRSELVPGSLGAAGNTELASNGGSSSMITGSGDSASGSRDGASGADAVNPAALAICGDSVCALSEGAKSCEGDCWGDCDTPDDISAWANRGTLTVAGGAGTPEVSLSCHSENGPNVVYSVQFPHSGIVSVSTDSPATSSNVALAIRSGDCSGREIDCNETYGTTSHARASAWLDANERGIIIIQTPETEPSLGLTLVFDRDNFIFDYSQSIQGTLAACQVALEDVYRVNLVESEGVRVVVDTTSEASAAHFVIGITNLTIGNIASSSSEIACSYAPGEAGCPAMNFEAASTGGYEFAIRLASQACGSAPPAYEFSVMRQEAEVDLELVADG